MRAAKNFAACFAIVLAFLFGQGAPAQTGRTIKMVVPFPAGGPGDILARLLGEQISRTRGSTLVVESRPGASGRIGTEAVARVPPDGRTLLIVANNFLIDPHVRRVDYDPFTSFEPICYLTNQPYILAIDSQSPYRTLADLLGAARALPGGLTMAGVGPASSAQIAFEMLKNAANVDVTFVPFAGSAPAVTALLGSHVTAALVPYSAAAEYLKAGKLRVLAAASERRVDPLPEVPALAEFGFQGIDADLWLAVFAPAKTSKESISELASWFAAALQTPEVKAKLVLQGQFPVGMCGTDFGAHLRKQYDEYGRIIREAGIKAE
jgi:tripartite-type tricarboxylate transporter receptor subunit TctC